MALAVMAMIGIWVANAPDPVDAAFGDGIDINQFEAYPSTTQAGGHPDLYIEFDIDNRYSPVLDHPCQCNDAKDLIFNFPAGFIGNPHAAVRCTAAEFAFNDCPMDAQIGVATPAGCLGGFCAPLPQALYNLVPESGQAGLIGFRVPIFDTPVYTELTARTGGDYGLRASVLGLQHLLPIPHFLQVIWGVPASPENDDWRSEPGFVADGGINFKQRNNPSNSPLTPYLTNPTTCGLPLETTMDVLAYDGGRSQAVTSWPATTGCGQLGFNPSLSAKPTTTQADTASGLDVVLTVPQAQSPTTPSPSSIRAVSTTLPEGFSVSPNAADGKTSCSDVAAKFGTEEQAECPEFSKVGSLEIHSAVLPDVLPGAVYLGEPLPGDRYRLFLVADGFGVHVKLPGTAAVDRQTGQITVLFPDLPQTPFEEFNMHIFGSERGLLSTPTRCGTYRVDSTFTPWNSELADQTSTQFFTIDSGPGNTACPGTTRPFNPIFKAASAGSMAGAYRTFSVQLARPDGDQSLSSLNVTTPPGFSGKLAGIPYCPESAVAMLSNTLYSGLAELASSACPAASQIGSATTGAGAGTRPVYNDGKVYLAGPYKGAPLSLVVVIPAVSGPYDLGNAVTRAAIHVDPTTARVSTISDQFPQIIEGIPLRVRSVMVKLDRPDFAINPTNCDEFSTDAELFGTEGAKADIQSHYQVANCASLDFAPTLGIDLAGSTKRVGHPALTATLTPQAGNANLARAQVTMPSHLLLDQSHIGTVCTRPQAASDTCPAAALYGTASAVTPLLDEPLTGNVYLVSSSNQLPDLLVKLKGQVDFNLQAKVDSVKGAIRTTFETTPDVPVTSFTLKMFGGKKGLLVNSKSLCRVRSAANRATVHLTGQNGKTSQPRTPISVPCGKGKAKRGKARAKSTPMLRELRVARGGR
jgi:hypothetical protein